MCGLIPTISADPKYKSDVLYCAEVVAKSIKDAGADDVEIFDSMFDLRLNFILSPLLICELHLPFLVDLKPQHTHRIVLFRVLLLK